MSQKCKRCGACQECGAVPSVYPYQWYPWHGVYPPYRVYPNTNPPYWQYQGGSTSGGIQSSSGTYQNYC